MMWCRRLGAVAALISLIVIFPYGLMKYGVMPSNSGLQIFTQRDDGTVFLFLLTVVGWVAWGIFAVATAVEIRSTLTGKHWQIPGISWAQSLVSGLVVLVFTVTPGVAAIAAPAQPLPHDHAQSSAVSASATTKIESSVKETYEVAAAASYQSYLVQAGDDLWSIAVAQFNDGLQWQRLYDMNRDVIQDPDHLEAGWVLRLPGLPRTGNVEISSPDKPVEAIVEHLHSATNNDIPVAEATSAAVVEASKSDSITELGPDTSVSANIIALTMGSFAAAAVLGAVAFYREGRELSRPLGKRFCDPTPSARRLETVMETRASGIKISDLDVVQRAISEYAKEQGDLPHIHYVELSNELISIYFLHDVSRAPIGFTAHERSWTIAAAAVEFLRADADTPYAWPALIPVGSRDSSVTIFIDLDEAGIFDVADPDILRALTAVLLSSSQIELVTVGENLLTPAFSGSHVKTNREALALLRAEAIPTIDRLSRLDQNLAEAVRPRIIVSNDFDEELSAFSSVLCIGQLPEATWKLDKHGLQTPHGQLSITPDKLAANEASDLQELVQSSRSQETELASWWSHDADSYSTKSISRPLSQLLVARAQEDDVLDYPTLYLLGPVELRGARGEIPPRAVKQCMEYAAWLMEHPGATASQMSTALIVAEGTRRSNMSRLRNWLGSHENGDPFLPDAYSGRILLSPDVNSDWQQLQLLIGPGVNRVSADSLAAALDLVRGAPLADAAPGQWIWAEPMRSRMVAVIRDIAARLAQIALDAGDYELVRWATARGFVVAPADELLTVLRVKAEYRTGNSAEVDRLINRLAYHARSLGVDLAEETVIALQEVMEGQVRARRVSQLAVV